MTKRAAIYCRISDDREGLGMGVKRQQEDCEAILKREGWELVDLYIDNDISAYSGKKRPSYERMLEDVKNGRIDVIVTWHSDRLHRQPKELEEFITICESTKVQVSSVQAGYLDFSTPGGRVNARIIGGMARYESEIKSERIKRKAKQSALEGKPWGRSQRPFGFEEDYLTVRESEAVIIREMADRYLAGESMNSLARSLSERGIRTSTGSVFGHQQLRRILVSPRWSGRREHLGEIVADAIWPAIIEPEKQDLIRKILLDPARTNDKKARRYLLSGGLIICGVCKQTMISHPKEDVRRYICRKDQITNGKACGKIYIKADWVEELISEGILMRLANPVLFLKLQNKTSGDKSKDLALNEYKKLSAREVELGELFAEGGITKEAFSAASKKLKANLKDLDMVLNSYAVNQVNKLHIEKAQDALKNWEHLSLDQQRATIKLVLDRVEIMPGRAGYNKIDLSRINPVWKV